MTLKDEDHLAAVFVGVHADSCSRDEATLEDAVCAVKEHVGSELLFAALEIWKDSHVHLIELYSHIYSIYFISSIFIFRLLSLLSFSSTRLLSPVSVFRLPSPVSRLITDR